MGLIDAFPLCQIHDLPDPSILYSTLMNLIVRLGCSGLIHGDFNEFNILIKPDNSPILIDFPQMVSTGHRNAEMYFNRDVECIKTFFKKRFRYQSKLYPIFSRDIVSEQRLDREVAASGFTKELEVVLERYVEGLREFDEDNVEPEDEGSDEDFENDVEDDEHFDEQNPVILENVQVDNWLNDHMKTLVVDGESSAPIPVVFEEEESFPNVTSHDASVPDTYFKSPRKLSVVEEQAEDEDENYGLEEINNKQFKAFRDPILPHVYESKIKSAQIHSSVTPEDIRRKVATSFRQRPAHGKKNKNGMKTKSAREVRDNIKTSDMWA
jgi:RIO kinase 2